MSFHAARRLLPGIVLMTALSGSVAFGVSTLLPKTYRSEVLLTVGRLLSAPGPAYDDLLISQSLSTMYAELATTRPIVQGAINRLDLDMTPLELAERVEVETTDGSFIKLAVEDNDGERAAAIANALAQELTEASPALSERQETAEDLIAADLRTTGEQIDTVEAEIAALEGDPERDAAGQARLERLQDRLTSLRAGRATLLGLSGPSTANVVTVVEPAVPAQTPEAPRPLLNSAVGAAAGLALSIGIVYLARERHT